MDKKKLFQNIEEIALQASLKAAISSSNWFGKGDSDAADKSAVLAMREYLAKQNILKGTVVIGEGERDKAPMLYIGEILGQGELVDIAVDPLEGTSLCANGGKNCITAIAIGESGTILNAPDLYMEKIASIKDSKGVIDLDNSIEQNITNLANLMEKDISDIEIIILDRPRHEEIINRARKHGARVSLIQDGDINAIITTVLGHADMYIGIGGAPEGVLAAAALKTIGGFMQTRLICGTEDDKNRAKKMNITDFSKKYEINDMIKGDVVFAITGISNGDICDGVLIMQDGKVKTHSLVLNSFFNTEREVGLICKV